jgi:L-ascorbate metabolism protein UlaG (beta-lactamase superfamily)
MKIKHLGQACFAVESSNGKIVLDPFAPMVGKMPKDLTASVVTVSHQHGDHSYTKGVGGNPEIIDQTGSWDIAGFEIQSVSTFHDKVGGKKRGNNIVYVIKSDGITICHLGDLGHKLSDEQLKEIGTVDILMIPVGGTFTIDPTEAVAVINQIKPKIVLPMHFKPKKSLIPFPLATVDKFTEVLGWPVKEVEELEVDGSNLDSLSHQAIIFKK